MAAQVAILVPNEKSCVAMFASPCGRVCRVQPRKAASNVVEWASVPGGEATLVGWTLSFRPGMFWLRGGSRAPRPEPPVPRQRRLATNVPSSGRCCGKQTREPEDTSPSPPLPSPQLPIINRQHWVSCVIATASLQLSFLKQVVLDLRKRYNNSPGSAFSFAFQVHSTRLIRNGIPERHCVSFSLLDLLPFSLLSSYSSQYPSVDFN